MRSAWTFCLYDVGCWAVYSGCRPYAEAALSYPSMRSPLTAIYNRSRYRPQVAAVLQRLADALDSIEHGVAT